MDLEATKQSIHFLCGQIRHNVEEVDVDKVHNHVSFLQNQIKIGLAAEGDVNTPLIKSIESVIMLIVKAIVLKRHKKWEDNETEVLPLILQAVKEFTTQWNTASTLQKGRRPAAAAAAAGGGRVDRIRKSVSLQDRRQFQLPAKLTQTGDIRQQEQHQQEQVERQDHAFEEVKQKQEDQQEKHRQQQQQHQQQHQQQQHQQEPQLELSTSSRLKSTQPWIKPRLDERGGLKSQEKLDSPHSQVCLAPSHSQPRLSPRPNPAMLPTIQLSSPRQSAQIQRQNPSPHISPRSQKSVDQQIQVKISKQPLQSSMKHTKSDDQIATLSKITPHPKAIIPPPIISLSAPNIEPKKVENAPQSSYSQSTPPTPNSTPPATPKLAINTSENLSNSLSPVSPKGLSKSRSAKNPKENEPEKSNQNKQKSLDLSNRSSLLIRSTSAVDAPFLPAKSSAPRPPDSVSCTPSPPPTTQPTLLSASASPSLSLGRPISHVSSLRKHESRLNSNTPNPPHNKSPPTQPATDYSSGSEPSTPDITPRSSWNPQKNDECRSLNESLPKTKKKVKKGLWNQSPSKQKKSKSKQKEKSSPLISSGSQIRSQNLKSHSPAANSPQSDEMYQQGDSHDSFDDEKILEDMINKFLSSSPPTSEFPQSSPSSPLTSPSSSSPNLNSLSTALKRSSIEMELELENLLKQEFNKLKRSQDLPTDLTFSY